MRGVSRWTLLVVVLVAFSPAWADEPQARLNPPGGVSAQARLNPPGGAPVPLFDMFLIWWLIL